MGPETFFVGATTTTTAGKKIQWVTHGLFIGLRNGNRDLRKFSEMTRLCPMAGIPKKKVLAARGVSERDNSSADFS